MRRRAFGFELTRVDLQKLADEKLSDALILFSAKSWSNAYYLAGYAVELAIKACIAKSFKADTVPDKDAVLKTCSHEFPKLIGIAGLTAELQKQVQGSQEFGTAWGVVNEWSRMPRSVSRPSATLPMDKDSLVEVGRTIVKGLQDDGVPVIAALWVREISDTGDDNWLLWLAPRTFSGANLLLRCIGDGACEAAAADWVFRDFQSPGHRSDELHCRRAAPIRPDRPRYLSGGNLGRTYLNEAIVLLVD